MRHEQLELMTKEKRNPKKVKINERANIDVMDGV